jgi:3-hydroxy-3-methylglutaryl CoA synthase
LNLTVQSNSGQIAVNSPGAVQANTLNIKVTKHKISVAAPAGSVGSDQAMTSYVTYLIARYQEFQKGHTSKTGQFKYIALHTALKRQFKGERKLLRSAKFEALVEFLHRRIDNTLIGRRNSAKGVASYRSFSEHG